MLAARIHEFGTNLQIDDIKEPVCPSDHVILKIYASSINHLDLWVKNGIPSIKIDLPFILGSDAAGEIVEVGKSVSDRKVGDKVIVQPGLYCGTCYYCKVSKENLCIEYGILGETHNGTHCEYIALNSKNVYNKFEHLSYEQSASIPLTFMTAYEMLVSKAQLKNNENVLIYGGTSGIGFAAITIAKFLNANIIATVGSEDKIDVVKGYGADYVLLHNDEFLTNKVKDIVRDKAVQVVFEHIGLSTWDTSIKVLSRGGRIVTCGSTTGPKVSINLQHLFYKQQKIIGSTMGTIKTFNGMLKFINNNKIIPSIDRVIPLGKINEAYTFISNRQQKGKVVVSINENSQEK